MSRKAAIIRIVREVCDDNTDPNVTVDRYFKFQVFCQVCDNLLKDGRITKAEHKRWTEVI
jgi:hypothetical protein